MVKKVCEKNKPTKRKFRFHESVLQNSPMSFRPSDSAKTFLEKIEVCGNQISKTINEALELLSLFRTNPKKIMEKLKKLYPLEWKYVNRRKW